jgi:hypothetical protein
MSTDDFALFDFVEPATTVTSPSGESPIRDEQVQHIRDAFAAAGIEGQDDRKTLIESVSSRPVGSLRDLLAVEASLILATLKKRVEAKPVKESTGSAWDDREEDTWIDKL